MFWVKTCEGLLVNLAQCYAIVIDETGSGHQVEAWLGGGNETGPYYVLFNGALSECGKFRDDLFDRLRSREKSLVMRDKE